MPGGPLLERLGIHEFDLELLRRLEDLSASISRQDERARGV
jgi:hypothetical protein